jgi:sugar (pentulose or hexulose) kinase
MLMGGREYEILASELGAIDEDATLMALPHVIEKKVLLLPNLAPSSGPFPGYGRKWINADDANLAEQWAAACLYLALMTDTCLSLIGAKGETLIEGPFASNRPYLQALASVTNRNVIALSGTTGTSHGAAFLAGIKWPADKGQHFEPASLTGVSDYKEAWHYTIERCTPHRWCY